MIDRTREFRATTRIVWLAAVLLTTWTSVVTAARAEEIPVSIYIGRDAVGSGGGTVHLTATGLLPPPGELTLPVWVDVGSAAAGQGVFSLQDVVIQSLDPLVMAIVDFTCVASSCRVGVTSDSAVEVRFAVGDDTSTLPSLTNRVRIGDITLANLFPGQLALVAGTALDANANGDLIAIAASPNEGLLVNFVPEPTFAIQMLAGLAGLCGLASRRRQAR